MHRLNLQGGPKKCYHFLYTFEDERGRSVTVTVNTDRYVEMLRRKFIPALRRKQGVNMNNVIYQQDGAPPHCSNVSLDFTGKVVTFFWPTL